MQLIRQAGILVAMAASVAVGVYVVLWALPSDYVQLRSGLSDRDLAEISQTLEGQSIPNRINYETRTVFVEADSLDAAQLLLAGSGLGGSTAGTVNLFDIEQGFGTSQRLEEARLNQALEASVRNSIEGLAFVQSANVILNMNRASTLVRNREPSSATVQVTVVQGWPIEPGNVQTIIDIVRGATGISLENVHVSDHRGAKLSANRSGTMASTSELMDFRRDYEEQQRRNIIEILEGMVGPGGVRATVNAEFDFTSTEQFSEAFNDPPIVRREETREETRSGTAGAGGVPGALSNEPPGQAAAPEVAGEGDGGEGQVAAASAPPANRTVATYRDNVVGRTISREQPMGPVLTRLSVAVLVRNPTAAAGQAAEIPAEQIERMAQLVREAVGFNETRGDTISVQASDFYVPDPIQAAPPTPLLQQPWVMSAVKQVLGGLFVLFLVFGVLRPVFKSLMARPEAPQRMLRGPDGQPMLAGPGDAEGMQGYGYQSGPALALSGPSPMDAEVERVRQYVAQDPKVAAQVVKNWVGDGQ